MDRRRFVYTLGALVSASTLAGCGSGPNTGTLATRVSDQPGDIADFDRLLVEITGIRVKPEDADIQEIDTNVEVDLTELTGEASALVKETDLQAGTNEFLQLVAEATEAELTGGGSATVQVPGDAPLKFNKQFEIRSGETTTFIADFTPVKQGQTDRYVLQPVADEVEIKYQTET